MIKKTKKYKGVWFYGLSGSGKTYASKVLFKKLKKSILIDGDSVRSKVSFDLGYSVRERKIQIKRLFGMSEISIASNIIPIVSSVYMNKPMCLLLKKKNILLIQIKRDLKILRKLKIYKKKRNVVGKDIFLENFQSRLIKNTNNILFNKEIEKIAKFLR
tara:strand:+ start:128 stop:604 length:477 start_codon:yes stop_codon:yes gene_type:complete